jgi:hypothetical protein
MLPAAPAPDIALPLAAAADTPITPMLTAPDALAASLTFTTPTTPLAIAFEFNPQIRQTVEPMLLLQVKAFDAADAMLPSETFTLVTLPTG